MADNQVRPIRRRSKTDVSEKLALGWHRVAGSSVRKAALAQVLETDAKTISRAIGGETVPELHTALNSLAHDPTALDEVFALYGGRFAPAEAAAGSDMELASGLGRGLAELIDRLRDGSRDHLDTLALAELFRPLLPQMQAVISEADRLRGHG